MSESPQTEQAPPKKPRDRSPSFPFIPLYLAAKRLAQLDEYMGRHPGRAEKSGLAWEMTAGSSQANQTLAALKAFGLIKYTGSGKDRFVEISSDGRKYLRAQQQEIKNSILKDAALKPKEIQKSWSNWGNDRPSDPICLDELILDRKYTENAAKVFLRVYDQTIVLAGLAESDKIPSVDDAEHKEDDDLNLQRGTPKVGDYVQWTSGGSDQFRISRRVTWISDDGSHARVHGSPTGIKMSELTVVDPPAPPPALLAGKAEASMSDSNDDAPDINIFLTGKRLQITADVDAKGIITLKKMLDQFEEALKLLSQPIQNFKRPEPDTSSDETE